MIDQPSMEERGFLPELAAAASLAEWPRLTADFARRPVWHGAPAETGALARCGDASTRGAYAARWLARLQELRDWAAGANKPGAVGTASASCVAPGIGRALVVTARGLLMHEISLDGPRIADYVIVAPTEWNFHPHGRLAEWLPGLPVDAAPALPSRIAWAVAALDPCVRWELDWLSA